MVTADLANTVRSLAVTLAGPLAPALTALMASVGQAKCPCPNRAHLL